MKRITPALIETHLGKQKRIKRRWRGGWFIELESGASVTITRKIIDFGRFREIENRGNVEEEIFQWEVEACLALGQEVWGGIRLFGKGGAAEKASILEYAAKAGINTGDQGLVFRHFGPEATFKYRLCGITVNLPNGGFVEIGAGAIQKVCGELFKPALSMLHEIAPGRVIVRGKPELLLLGVQYGKLLNIEVIPESDLGTLYAVTGALVQLICIALGSLWFGIWTSLVGGYMAGMALCMLGVAVFGKQLTALARRRGLEIVGAQPVTSADRKATMTQARERGML